MDLGSNKKIAVNHILSSVKPKQLRNRLESDLELTHISIRKEFNGFMKHALTVSDAFELNDNGLMSFAVPSQKPGSSKKSNPHILDQKK